MNRQQIAIIAAVIALVYLSILLPLEVGAQDNPPPLTPEISATWWVPTPTPMPTPVIVRPMPLGPCRISPGCALLPIVRAP